MPFDCFCHYYYILTTYIINDKFVNKNRSNQMRLSIPTLLLAAVVSWGVELGDFTSENGYYLIQSANDLKKLATYVNNGGETSGKKFKLTANIALSSDENFTPIGTRKSFSGTFEGNNKTISGLSATCYAEGYNATYCGLFGSNYGTIQNVHLKNVRVSGSGTYVYKGGIAGYSYGTISDCTVESITISGSRAGGIVGENDGTISRCKVTKATINSASSASSYTSVGGIAGGQGSGAGSTNLITKCEVRSSKLYGEGYVGGIIGYSSNATRVSSSLVANSEVYGTYDYGVVASGATQSLNYYYKTSLNGTMNSNTVKMTFNHSASNHCKATPYSVLGMTYENDGYYTSGANIQFTFAVDQAGYGCKYQLASSNPVLYGSGDKVSITINRDTTVTVSDSIFRYSITYVLNDKGTNPAYTATSYTVENTITLPTPTPSEEGYVFSGWYETSDFAGDPVESIPTGSTGDKKFYALWQKDIATHPDITFEEIPDQVWTGYLLQPPVTVKDTTADITEYMGEPFYSYSEVGEASVRLYPPKRINGVMNKYCGRLELKFNIVKATPTVVPPVPEDLRYRAIHMNLVTEGSTSKGTMTYSLDGETFSERVPYAISAGTYTVYYKVSLNETDKQHYEEVSGSVQATIKKAQVSIEATPNDWTYDGEAHMLLSVTKGTCQAYTSVNGKAYLEYYQNYSPKATNAGTYTILVKPDPQNCEGDVVEIQTVVKKATPTITPPTARTLTYNETAQVLATEGSTNQGTMLYSLDGTNFSEEVPTATTAGTYTLHYMVEESANWEKVLSSINVVIRKKAVSQMEPTANELTYNGNAQELVTANNSGLLCTEYSLDGTNFSKTIPSRTYAGVYNVHYRLDEENCSGNVTAGSVPVTIYSATLTAIPKGTAYKYDGEPHELATAIQPSICKVKFSLDGGESFSSKVPIAVDAGDYQIIYQIDDRTCYGKGMSGEFKSSIARVYATKPTPNKLEYNGTEQALVTAGYPSTCLSYSLDKTNYSKDIPTKVNAGHYDVYFRVADLRNCYEDEGLVETVIRQAQPKVNEPVARELMYNGKAQELVTAGSANSGPMLYSLDGKTFSESIPTAVNAGKYNVIARVNETENYGGYVQQFEVTIYKAKNYVFYPIDGNRLEYNGKPQELITEESPNICLVYSALGDNFSIEPSKKIPTATNAGDYLVMFEFDSENCDGSEKSGKAEASIKKVPVTPPQAKILAFTGEPQELITEGQPGACLTYSLDKINFSENIPTAVYPGEYTIYYMVDKKNCEGEPGGLLSYIEDKLPNITIVAPIAAKVLTYTGKKQSLLVKPGYVDDNGRMLYSLDNINFSEEPPTAVDPGIYTIYYRAEYNQYVISEGTLSTVIAHAHANFAFIDLFRIGDTRYAAIDGDYTEKNNFDIDPSEVDSVIFNRKFPITKGMNFSTLMLPFEAQLSQLEGISGSNVFEFKRVSRNEETKALQVEITPADYIEAYKPYIVQMSSPTLKVKGKVLIQKLNDKPITNRDDWTLVGTVNYTKWEKGHKQLGNVYGFSATPFEATNGKRYSAGQFVKFSPGSFIKPLRAFLLYEGKTSSPAPSVNGYAAPVASIEEFPDMIDVVIVERDDNGEEHTTVIGKFNTRTGEIRLNRGTRTFDLKGRSVGKHRAKGMYLKK